MKLLYAGPLWEGGTALQRARAFASLPGVVPFFVDTTAPSGAGQDLYYRIRWKIGWPIDHCQENNNLVDSVIKFEPDVVIIDNSKVIKRSTIEHIRTLSNCLMAYYSPDDMMARHNLKYPLKKSLSCWDIIFTTKTYNVEELRSHGVHNSVLVGNAFDPKVHKPISAMDIGNDYEHFDLVFIGAFESERASAIFALAKSGMRVLVHGVDAGAIAGRWSKTHPNITLRAPVYADDYARCMHHGKVALCFLRKINRDQITTRSVEIPAMKRPMLAEKTTEHDAYFEDGVEYLSFIDDNDLVAKARSLIADSDRRRQMAAAGYNRCYRSGYGISHRAEQMLEHIKCQIERNAR